MMCDMIVAPKSATFGLYTTGLSLILGADVTQHLAKLVGSLKATELVPTERNVPAAKPVYI